MTDYQKLTYLDNAATTPTTLGVTRAIADYYQNMKVNVHRGMYQLANEVTNHYEAVRQQVADFIHASDAHQVVFTSGATDSLNLVAFGYGAAYLKPGDEIIVSIMEHHSNLVPWQQVAKRTGAKLRFVDVDNDGKLKVAQLKALLNPHTKIVSLTLVSNVLGTYTNMIRIAKLVHAVGAKLVVDAAQAVAHLPINVAEMDADWLAFSGHKMFGPTGIGVLYGKLPLLNQMQPTRFGGEMIMSVSKDDASFQEPPLKFEAGTPNIAGVLGLGVAIDYLNEVGYAAIMKRDQQLVSYLMKGLRQMNGVQIYGSSHSEDHVAVVSFNVVGYHAHDIATILDSYDVAVRAGHHCAEPLMHFLGVESVVRASVSFKNTKAEIDQLLNGLQAVKEILT